MFSKPLTLATPSPTYVISPTSDTSISTLWFCSCSFSKETISSVLKSIITPDYILCKVFFN